MPRVPCPQGEADAGRRAKRQARAGARGGSREYETHPWRGASLPQAPRTPSGERGKTKLRGGGGSSVVEVDRCHVAYFRERSERLREHHFSALLAERVKLHDSIFMKALVSPGRTLILSRPKFQRGRKFDPWPTHGTLINIGHNEFATVESAVVTAAWVLKNGQTF